MAVELKKILLVEDNSYDMELTLEALKDYNVANNIDVVNDGEEALNYLYRRRKFAARPTDNPVVIILDLKLPKVNGLEVLAKIKSDEQLKLIPVVILTSLREERDLIESYKLGVNAYVVKPVKFNNLMEAVKSLAIFWALINEPPPGGIN